MWPSLIERAKFLYKRCVHLELLRESRREKISWRGKKTLSKKPLTLAAQKQLA